jgi:hypothetical protein
MASRWDLMQELFVSCHPEHGLYVVFTHSLSLALSPAFRADARHVQLPDPLLEGGAVGGMNRCSLAQLL